jgi:hypothetical protein
LKKNLPPNWAKPRVPLKAERKIACPPKPWRRWKKIPSALGGFLPCAFFGLVGFFDEFLV